MNAPARFDAATATPLPKPSLEQRLRFIDLSFECAREAARWMPTQNRRFHGDYVERNPARETLIRQLRLEAMEREGLPLSLLPDPAPLSSFSDIIGEGERPRHALQGRV